MLAQTRPIISIASRLKSSFRSLCLFPSPPPSPPLPPPQKSPSPAGPASQQLRTKPTAGLHLGAGRSAGRPGRALATELECSRPPARAPAAVTRAPTPRPHRARRPIARGLLPCEQRAPETHTHARTHIQTHACTHIHRTRARPHGAQEGPWHRARARAPRESRLSQSERRKGLRGSARFARSFTREGSARARPSLPNTTPPSPPTTTHASVYNIRTRKKKNKMKRSPRALPHAPRVRACNCRFPPPQLPHPPQKSRVAPAAKAPK